MQPKYQNSQPLQYFSVHYVNKCATETQNIQPFRFLFRAQCEYETEMPKYTQLQLVGILNMTERDHHNFKAVAKFRYVYLLVCLFLSMLFFKHQFVLLRLCTAAKFNTCFTFHNPHSYSVIQASNTCTECFLWEGKGNGTEMEYARVQGMTW